MATKTLQEIASLLQGELVGNGTLLIEGVTNMETPGPGLITFAQDGKTLKRLEQTDIACLIVSSKVESSIKPVIKVTEPKLAWAKLLELFYPSDSPSQSISDQAFISPKAKIGSRVTIEPFAVISDGAVIGDESIIGCHVYIGQNAAVGEKSRLHSGVKVYRNCRIGSRVILHGNAVIGADGFGYVHTLEGQQKVPQVGNVVIEDDVEIGACTTIDRATVGSTTIGQGCKIDNLVQIAHNVQLGPHTVISSQTGISGSSKIGSHVTMGGKVGLGDHVEIGDWTMIGAGAGFPSGKKVPPKQILFGEPARPYREARRQIAAQWRSAEMLDDIRKLKTRLDELEKSLSKEAPSS